MRYLPSPGRWRRKVVASAMVLLFLPVLLEAGMDALGAMVQLVDHLVGQLWPLAAVFLFVSLGAYAVRALYRRRW